MIRLVVIIVIIGALFFSYAAGLGAGKRIQAGIEAQARQELIKNQAERVKIVYKEKVKIDARHRDRVKKIYIAKDATGCLDRTLSDVGLLPAPASD